MNVLKKTFKEGKMKKLLKTAIFGTVVTAILSGESIASTLDTTGGSNPDTGCYTVSSEWLNYQDVDSSISGTKVDLSYTPDIDLGVNNIIVLKFNGGALKPTPGNVMYLADAGGDGIVNTGTDPIVAQMIDYTVDADGNYTSITLKFTQTVASGSKLFLVDDATTDTSGNLFANSTGFYVITYQNSTGVTAQVISAQDDTGTPLQAPLTGIENITCATKQLSVVIAETQDNSNPNSDPALDTIDVNPPLYRKGFLDDDSDGNYDSDVRVSVINNNLDIALPVDSNDTYTLTLKGDFTGVQSIVGIDEDSNNINATQDADGNYVISTSFNDSDSDNTADLDVVITVDGQTALNPQTITADLVFDFNEILAANDTNLFSDRSIIKWDINGAQFKVPYLYNNSNTWVRISNDGPVAGEITADVFDEAGNKQTNVSLGVVQPNSSVVIYASDIVNAAIQAGWAATNVTRFTAIFTVAAPAGNISAVAVQRIPGGVDRVIPVLDSESTWDQ